MTAARTLAALIPPIGSGDVDLAAQSRSGPADTNGSDGLSPLVHRVHPSAHRREPRVRRPMPLVLAEAAADPAERSVEARLAEAEERGRAAGEAAAAERHAETLAAAEAALRDRHARELAVLAEEMSRQLAATLEDHLAALSRQFAEVTARTLAPVLEAGMHAKAIEALADEVRDLLSGADAPTLSVTGPADLLEALAAVLGTEADRLDAVATPHETELRVVADYTVFETRLEAWRDRTLAALAGEPPSGTAADADAPLPPSTKPDETATTVAGSDRLHSGHDSSMGASSARPRDAAFHAGEPRNFAQAANDDDVARTPVEPAHEPGSAGPVDDPADPAPDTDSRPSDGSPGGDASAERALIERTAAGGRHG